MFYQILQINKKILNYSDYFNENSPVIILNVLDDNSNLKEIINPMLSPLTIRSKHIENVKLGKSFAKRVLNAT